MNDLLYRIIVGFQYARLDFLNKYPKLRNDLEEAFSKLYMNWLKSLSEKEQLYTIQFSGISSIREMSDRDLINKLETFLNREEQLKVIDPDSAIQFTLLGQIQQYFSLIELTNYINDAYGFED